MIHLLTSKKLKIIGFDLTQTTSSVNLPSLAHEIRAPQLAIGRCEPVGDIMAYGNGQGLSLLQELESAKEDRERIRHIIDMQAQQAAAINDLAHFKEAQDVKNELFESLCRSTSLRVNDISGAVHLLSSASEAYLDIRNGS